MLLLFPITEKYNVFKTRGKKNLRDKVSHHQYISWSQTSPVPVEQVEWPMLLPTIKMMYFESGSTLKRRFLWRSLCQWTLNKLDTGELWSYLNYSWEQCPRRSDWGIKYWWISRTSLYCISSCRWVSLWLRWMETISNKLWGNLMKHY